jgi:hypothetical protein
MDTPMEVSHMSTRLDTPVVRYFRPQRIACAEECGHLPREWEFPTGHTPWLRPFRGQRPCAGRGRIPMIPPPMGVPGRRQRPEAKVEPTEPVVRGPPRGAFARQLPGFCGDRHVAQRGA